MFCASSGVWLPLSQKLLALFHGHWQSRWSSWDRDIGSLLLIAQKTTRMPTSVFVPHSLQWKGLQDVLRGASANTHLPCAAEGFAGVAPAVFMSLKRGFKQGKLMQSSGLFKTGLRVRGKEVRLKSWQERWNGLSLQTQLRGGRNRRFPGLPARQSSQIGELQANAKLSQWVYPQERCPVLFSGLHTLE